jgi:hypothetical protein
MPHVMIGVAVAVPVPMMRRRSSIGWLYSKQALDAADNTADHPANYRADRSRSLPSLRSSMRNAAGHALCLRCERVGERSNERASEQYRFHAQTPFLNAATRE